MNWRHWVVAKGMLFFIASTSFSTLLAQSDFLMPEQFFGRQDVKLSSRLRGLQVLDILPEKGDEMVVMAREGTYPDWKMNLSIYQFQIQSRAMKLKTSLNVPQGAIFYSFHSEPMTSKPFMIWIFADRLEFWPWAEDEFRSDSKLVLPLDLGFHSTEKGEVSYVSMWTEAVDGKETTCCFIPTGFGYAKFGWSGGKPDFLQGIPALPRSYYTSGFKAPALQIPNLVRASFWFPKIYEGSLDGLNRNLFLPWMDEVEIFKKKNHQESSTHYFRVLSESDRDSELGYAVLSPLDLNADGKTDFLVNRFQGAATSFQAKTKVFWNQEGRIAKEGEVLQVEGNRAAGAIPIDINRDGYVDLAVASSQFNAWSIARAVLRREVKVLFSFYLSNEKGLNLGNPDFTRETTFGFSLADADIDGVLPDLSGDFNGDGLPDAIYARDRKTLTILLQRKNSKDLFPDTPSATYDISISKNLLVGDLNGDGWSDVVLYGKNSQENQSVTVLINRAKLR